MLVEQGKTVSQNILTDWTDPDGDDLVLMDAKADNDQDQVKVRRDGLLTYQDSGAAAGKKSVTVTVWDGRATTTGKVVVNVQPPGALPPVVNADHVTAVVGQDLVIAPLKNDVDPNGGALRLAQVEAAGPAELGPVTDGGTFTFRSSTPGPIYLTYIASNGPQSSQGLIRVDVESGKDAGNPVAVHDVALMPVGGSVLLDPLANDSDPSGGVLVLQSVQLPENATASVSVIDHSVLRITDVAGHQRPVHCSATPCPTARKSATGSVSVVPVPAPAVVEAPQPKPDEVNVRVNDVVTIPVLANDTHPQGEKLTVDPVLPQPVPETDGKSFVSENTLRFIAGAEPKTVRAIYNAVDPQGQKSAAAVTIHILPLEGAENSRPQPQEPHRPRGGGRVGADSGAARRDRSRRRLRPADRDRQHPGDGHRHRGQQLHRLHGSRRRRRHGHLPLQSGGPAGRRQHRHRDRRHRPARGNEPEAHPGGRRGQGPSGPPDRRRRHRQRHRSRRRPDPDPQRRHRGRPGTAGHRQQAAAPASSCWPPARQAPSTCATPSRTTADATAQAAIAVKVQTTTCRCRPRSPGTTG